MTKAKNDIGTLGETNLWGTQKRRIGDAFPNEFVCKCAILTERVKGG